MERLGNTSRPVSTLGATAHPPPLSNDWTDRSGSGIIRGGAAVVRTENLTDLCFDSRGGRFRFYGSGLKRCFGPFVRNPSSIYIFRAKTTASTPVTPGPRILDAKAMSDPHSAQDGPSTKGSPSAGTASILDGNGILPDAFYIFSPYSRVLLINGC